MQIRKLRSMKFNEFDTLDFDDTAPLASRISSPREAPLHVDFGACSHLGNVRRNNEDHYAVICRKRSREVLLTNMPRADLSLPDDESYVLVVADGMGGAVFGELASRLALKTADELVGSACGWITKLQDVDFPPIQDRIQAYADLIHETLVDYGQSDPRLAGMGTTLTCAHALGSDVIIAHVGDSRAYHFREGTVEQVTRDQTLAQELMDAGMPARDTARFRHILTNCLGGDARAVRSEVYHLRLQDGDALLLCTDGLSDLIGNHEIAPVLDECGTAQDACDRLVRMALDRGGKDNITVVLGRFLKVAAAAPVGS
jgi:PPM family protein phosphatase